MKSASSPVARALLAVSLCLISAHAAAFSTEPYFPLPDGATWTYSVSDGSTEVSTVVGSRIFNGASVKIIRDQAGSEDYLTNDAAGVRFHGGLFVDPAGNETDTYNPPIVFIAREASIGTPVSTSGTVTAEVDDGSPPTTLDYNAVSTPLGFETVIVPAGTFTNALHVQLTLNYPGFTSQTLDLWLVAGIGSVREALAFEGLPASITWELVSYSIPVPGRTRADFNGDGRSDILWRNVSSGENYLYPMDGRTILATEGSVRTVADQNWQVAGVGDFDGDGKADILWRNASTGENYLYFMDGRTIKPTEGYIRSVTDQNWQVAGVGDFDGDGKDDILWRNAVTGENYLYLMDGKTIKPGEGYLRAAGIAWQVVGVGDFDGDGKADILWRNSVSGQNYVYPMDGKTIKPSEGFIRTVADPAWQVKGVGDFDGDGKADILWRNGSTGENYLYPMNGTAIKPSEGYVRAVPNLDWQVVQVGDFDGDGKADVFWRNASSGENYLYPMDGTTIKPSEGYVRGVAPPNWTVVSR